MTGSERVTADGDGVTLGVVDADDDPAAEVGVDVDPEVADVNPEVAGVDPEVADVDPEVADVDPEVAGVDPEVADVCAYDGAGYTVTFLMA